MKEVRKETLFKKFLLDELEEKNPFISYKPKGGRIGNPDRKNQASLLLMSGGPDTEIAKKLKMPLGSLRNLKLNGDFKIVQTARYEKFIHILSDAIENEVSTFLESTKSKDVDIRNSTFYNQLSDIHHCSDEFLKFLLKYLFFHEVPEHIGNHTYAHIYREMKFKIGIFILSRRKEPKLVEFGKRIERLRTLILHHSVLKDVLEELKKPSLNKEDRNALIFNLESVSSKFKSEISELKIGLN